MTFFVKSLLTCTLPGQSNGETWPKRWDDFEEVLHVISNLQVLTCVGMEIHVSKRSQGKDQHSYIAKCFS